MERFPWLRGRKKEEGNEEKLYEVRDLKDKQIKKWVEKAFPGLSLQIQVVCERDNSCQLIASHDLGFIGRRELYCLDKPGHFCTCLMRTKKDKQKVLNKATIIKIDREDLEKVQQSEPMRFMAVLKLIPEALRTYEPALRKIIARYSKKELKSKVTQQRVLREFAAEIESLRPDLGEKFREVLALEHDSYMAFTDMKGRYATIVPYSPKSFGEIRGMLKEWVDEMQKLLRRN